MTQTTDQDRAGFEAWARVRYPSIDLTRDGDDYDKALAKDYWSLWQAARRAQVVPDKMHANVMKMCYPLGAAAPQPPEGLKRENPATNPEVESVPKFNHAAKRKLGLLQGGGASITGYAIEKDGRRGAIDCHGFVYWWNEAAAPLPPEAASQLTFETQVGEAAPVQLPEPQAEIEVRSMKTYLDLSIHEWRDTLPDGEYKIYTEHQVRQLLAAHGIK